MVPHNILFGTNRPLLTAAGCWVDAIGFVAKARYYCL